MTKEEIKTLYPVLEMLAGGEEGAVYQAIGMLMEKDREALAKEAKAILDTAGTPEPQAVETQPKAKPVINGTEISTTDDLREALSVVVDGGESVAIFDDYAECVVGLTEDDRVVYSYDKMMDYIVARDGITYDEAKDFIDYNIISTLPYMHRHPVIIYPVDYNE